tara:strand:- start:498 stop:860 length:363 start_codon:yes stop_codon:yes gene_type:complete
MKLTIKKLKQLIKEELNILKEATPNTDIKGVFEYEGNKIRYYVYPKWTKNMEDDVEGFKRGLVGHYEVKKPSALYNAIANAIANDYPEAQTNDIYVVGLENEEDARSLIKSDQIVKDRSS